MYFLQPPMIIGRFSLLHDRLVATSHSVSLSFHESAKLEGCLHGMIESQSFSLWDLVSVFTFLKDYGCLPEGDFFHQLLLSLSVSLHSQAKASFSAASFLLLKQRETLVSYLPSTAHASVKHALLTLPSSSSLFAEDVFRDSLT